MFGRKPDVVFYPVGGRGGDTHHTHVKIEQQPHDAVDAARLYGDLVKKAREEVHHMIAGELPGIDARFTTFEAFRRWDSFSDALHAAFKINGREMVIKIDLPEGSLTHSKRDHGEAVYKAISEALAAEILKQMLRPLATRGLL